MFDALKYYRTIRRLNAELNRTCKAHSAIIERRKKDGLSGDELHNLEQELVFDEWEIEDRIKSLMSRRLCKEAASYRVPIPSHNDEDVWEKSDRSFIGYFLTPKGYAELRAAVRKEKNERWQSWALRLQVLGPILAGLTGAMGALIGLLTIWFK
jgi:hypothetical protein